MPLPSPDESPIPLEPPSKPGPPPRRENVPPRPGSVPDEPLAPPVQPPQYDPPEQPVPPAWDSPGPETMERVNSVRHMVGVGLGDEPGRPESNRVLHGS
jgi:hypothetical protein